MQRVLLGLNPEEGPDFVSVYIDDVVVFSRMLEEHLIHLRRVIGKIQESKLKLKLSKCCFIREEVDYLGHVLTPQGLRTNTKLVAAVMEFPQPQNLKEVTCFLGLSSYYRRFIPQFSAIAQTLNCLTRKGVEFIWTEECQESFDSLKQKLATTSVLAYPSFDMPFVLETDASILGIGAVLSQPQADGLLHPVAYASRSLNPCECNYSITELETLAVVWAMQHFRSYLYGHSVTVYTDHTAVKAILEMPNPSGKHARWWTKVYGSGVRDVKIVHRTGKSNVNADALSRSPQAAAPEEGIGQTELQVSAISSGSDSIEDSIQRLLAASPENTEPKSFGEEQRMDQQVLEVIRFLEMEELPGDPKRARKVATQQSLFSLIDDVLYFIDPKRDHAQRIVVPSHLRVQILEENHRSGMGGHFSGKRLFDTLVRHWWWERMYTDAVEYAKNCPECAIATRGGRPHHPPLHPIPVSRAFQIVILWTFPRP